MLEWAIAIVPVLLTTAFAGVAWLIRSSLAHFDDKLAQLVRDGAKLEGKIDLLQKDIRDNTVEITRATAELKAVWRFIDAPPRASDRRASNE